MQISKLNIIWQIMLTEFRYHKILSIWSICSTSALIFLALTNGIWWDFWLFNYLFLIFIAAGIGSGPTIVQRLENRGSLMIKFGMGRRPIYYIRFWGLACSLLIAVPTVIVLSHYLTISEKYSEPGFIAFLAAALAIMNMFSDWKLALQSKYFRIKLIKGFNIPKIIPVFALPFAFLFSVLFIFNYTIGKENVTDYALLLYFIIIIPVLLLDYYLIVKTKEYV